MKAAQAIQQQKDSEFVIDESVPYAELWIGTHPSGMSTVTVNNVQHTLLEYVKSDPELHCGKKESNDLSFLFKVLSISKVLSIQAHPDKKLAEQLHAASPHIYKDPNHKPEMAIALSEQVQAMVGFRPIHEIAEHIQSYPEFRALLGDQVADEVVRMVHSPATRAVLQHMFKAYLESPNETVQAQLTCLLDRLKSLDERDELQNIMIQFSEQFPGDSGIMAPLMFNVVTCAQGEAIFIGANEPHVRSVKMSVYCTVYRIIMGTFALHVSHSFICVCVCVVVCCLLKDSIQELLLTVRNDVLQYWRPNTF
jgi:mannose-6-phosphate isomerase